jgi:hypothetical protein
MKSAILNYSNNRHHPTPFAEGDANRIHDEF